MSVLLDNIIFSLQSHGGISTYWNEILARAAKAGETWVDPYLGFGNQSRPPEKQLPYRRAPAILPPPLERYRRVSCDLPAMHSSYYRIPKNLKTKLITTVYDFTYERYRRGPALWAHHAQKMRAIRRSDKILCISESTARDVIRFGGVELASKIVVTHLAASSDFTPVPNASAALSSRYPWISNIARDRRILLFVGARTGYKRFDLAVLATKKFPDSHLIVIGGGQMTKDEGVFAEPLIAAQRITFIAELPRGELPLWYSSAYALFYLSDYEGFGLPVLEAAQCNCPVLAQKTSSIPEVYGCPEFLVADPENVDNIVGKLRDLDSAKIKAEVLARCGERAQTFSWGKCWDITYNCYGSI